MRLRQRLLILFDQIDLALTNWMAKYSLIFLRYSLALIFIWFGILKFIPGMSPTVDIIENATNILFFGALPTWVALYGLATIECLIGFGLLFNIFMRVTLLGLFAQMIATSMPVFILPEIIFSQFPFGLTMEGHHLVKNLVLISAGLALGATVRGRKNNLAILSLKR
jgi:uncharacterized membrane protein YkgB